MEKTKLQMDVAQKLFNAREKSKLTQEDLAKKLSTSQSNLARIENGQNIRISTLFDYAQACGKKVKSTIH